MVTIVTDLQARLEVLRASISSHPLGSDELRAIVAQLLPAAEIHWSGPWGNPLSK